MSKRTAEAAQSSASSLAICSMTRSWSISHTIGDLLAFVVEVLAIPSLLARQSQWTCETHLELGCPDATRRNVGCRGTERRDARSRER